MNIFSLILMFHILPFSHAQNLEHGLWKSKSSFNVNGLPLPESEIEECITASEVKDIKATIVKDLKKNKCSLDSWKTKGQTLVAALNCQSPELEAKGKLRGQFTTKSYDLSGEAEGTYQKMIPAKATLKLKGEWVSECTPK